MAEEVSSPRDASSPASGSRRVLTTEESAQFRHRPTVNRFSTNLDGGVPDTRRRSANLSDFSLNDARKQMKTSTDDILLPKAGVGDQHGSGASHWHSVPLAFALLPAIGGMLFQNGSAVVTDLMILGLAAIFLNWSVRLPWDWYQSAQGLRIREEYNDDTVVDEESGDDNDLDVLQASLDGVPKDGPTSRIERKRVRRLPAHESAANELYAHELLALLSCFVFPVLGAYLLHSIRSSLSRPSEGLVSDYNLTIFLLASELRPMTHLVKLIQSRTLHLQRIVNGNPSGHSADDIENLAKRMDDLEARSSATGPTSTSAPPDPAINGKQVNTAVTEVRRTLQPELDSLNRAVRRYEKRLATQTMQTEARLLDLESRLSDAISLAAAAAINGQRPRHGLISMLIEWIVAAFILPLQAFGALASLPFKTIIALIGFGKTKITGKQLMDRGRKTLTVRTSHGRIGTDRMQGKVFKK